MTKLNSDVIDRFKGTLRGPLLQPADAGYDQARTVWNAMIDRRPALIACCAGTADVRAAVAFARDHGLPLAVRGGGHGIAGNAVCDDGLVINLSGMRAVHVDPQARLAFVGGGATLGDADHETQAYALAVPFGINSTTGVAGLALGGGFGWLSRVMGLTVDSLVGAEIVTADGERRHVSQQQEPDLFWAIRGGGGNFGVVTQFEFALHPVGPLVTAGLVVFPSAQGRAVMRQYRDFVNSLPDELSVWAVLRKAPPLPFLPSEVHGQDIVALAVFSPLAPDAALPMIAPLRGFGQVLGEHVGPMPYTAWQKIFDPMLTFGARNYWKSHNFTALSDEAIDVVLRYAGSVPTPQCEIFLGLLGGKANEPAPDATAYPHRHVQFAMNVHGRWTDAADDARCMGWAREFFAAAAPYAAGSVYINFMTQDEGARIREAYGANYERLVQVKRRYDPENLFHFNHNVPPGLPPDVT
ncbi:FAD-binding oxidoreductase [Massilia horti]|uniref:FAD-binding oxidoreductase n=1 Tax=Massilia horti TaxID=2562153 RepID=A0A4Y9SX85_9BURK|nr:FAD-binding oxidoreductase [Massilia horti]TFW31448.1 FAD-binding oxidoreductase [Massilia horti]TFW31461.1 FAD-binding oxidoreductase [Massilia horti]